MATLAALQQNPLFQAAAQRQVNRDAFADLLADPMTYLGQTVVVCGVGAGHQTVMNMATPLNVNGFGFLTVGVNANPALNPGAITVPALASSTRQSSGPHFVNRLAATARFGLAAGAQLWITDQQTGCTVLALDWGGQYSLVHLLPYSNDQYSIWSKSVFSVSQTARAEIKNASLRTDATTIVDLSSMGGALPLNYILLQSMHSITSAIRMQTIGVQRNGGWEFYRQTQNGVGGGLTVASVTLAPWRPWNEYFYWDV